MRFCSNATQSSELITVIEQWMLAAATANSWAPSTPPPSLHQSDLNPDHWSLPEKVGEFSVSARHKQGKRILGRAADRPKCHCLDRNATKRGERGVLDKTGGGEKHLSPLSWAHCCCCRRLPLLLLISWPTTASGKNRFKREWEILI